MLRESAAGAGSDSCWRAQRRNCAAEFSTTATLILFFGAKTSTFAAYQTTIGGQEPSTNVKVSL